MMLLAGSQAIDAGTAGGLSNDQRGEPRPTDFYVPPHFPLGGDGSDIGAVEVQRGLINGIIPNKGGLLIYWESEPGWNWTVQQSSDLSLGRAGWRDSGLPVMKGNGTNSVVIPSPSGNQFYRLTLSVPWLGRA